MTSVKLLEWVQKDVIYLNNCLRKKLRNFTNEEVLEYLFKPKSKDEEERNISMVAPNKKTMKFLHGQSIRRDIDGDYILRSEDWLKKANDEPVFD